MGLHDDSFAYSTLGSVGWFFWPRLVSGGYTDFWKKGPMGGETRPEIQNDVFDPSYVPAPDYAYKQDFMQCVETTHATYMFTHAAFISGNFVGTELENAKKAHARLGYNFYLSNVAVSASTGGTVIVDVTIKQVGVAPFYYPLSLALSCSGTWATLSGVDTLIEAGSTKVFSFASIPADKTCLENVRFSLESPFAYAEKPIKFAQGNGGVVLNLPLLNGSTPIVPASVAAPVSAPTSAPVPVPSKAPVRTPTKVPTRVPTKTPIRAPTNAPALAPTAAPTKAPTPAPVVATTAAPIEVVTAAPISPAPVQPITAAPVRPPTSAPPASLFIDGTVRDSPRYVISGSTSVTRSNTARLADVGGYKGSQFRHHRWSPNAFRYTIAGFAPSVLHTVTLGFAETYQPNCGTGKRVFNVVANDVQVVSNLDVFSVAGCKRGFTSTHTVTANEFGEIEIKFVPVRENPFISFIHIVESGHR
jgi:Malectin domain